MRGGFRNAFSSEGKRNVVVRGIEEILRLVEEHGREGEAKRIRMLLEWLRCIMEILGHDGVPESHNIMMENL